MRHAPTLKSLAIASIATTTVMGGGSLAASFDAAVATSLSNPGFESGLTGWAPLAGTGVALVQDVVHSGANAAALHRTKAQGPAAVSDSPDMFTGLATGTTCTASAWVHGPTGLKATVKFVAKSGATTVKTSTKTLTFNGLWQQLPTLTMVMPSGASTADLVYTAPAFPLGQTWNLDDTSASCGASSSSSAPTSSAPTSTAPTSSAPTSTAPTSTAPTSTAPTSTAPTSSPPTGPVPTDQAIASGLYDGNPYHTYGAFPYDYDNDGLQDVLMAPHNVTGGPRLFRNDGGGHFTHVFKGGFISRSPSGQIRNDRHGCAWGDVDNDGLPDLFCTMGANHGTLTDKANELWIQQQGGGFVNQAVAWGVTDPLGVGRGAAFLDVNHDGFLDPFVTNHTRSDGQASPNRLYINQGGASFRDAPEYGLDVELGALPGNQTCDQVVDFNQDSWPDLFVCGHTGLKLYRNDSGKSFTDVTGSSGLATGAWRHAVLADLNHDGLLDITGINGATSQFWIQLGTGPGTFGPRVVTRTITAGRQVGIGDMNGDGNQDVYIVTGNLNPDILLLGSGDGRNFTEQASLPQALSGAGQSVTPFDYDQNGTMDMIVMNGDGTDGPVQLLSFANPS